MLNFHRKSTPYRSAAR